MITNDYDRGLGYDGLLSEAGEALFGRSVEAVADAWHTVLIETPLDVDVEPSPQALTWYFVNAIRYLLYEKDNYYQAVQTYDILERVNPGIAEAYTVLGDLFYEYATEESIERGVREWKIAQRIPGPHRSETSAKLAKHYIGVGQEYLEKGLLPTSPETDLQNALKNFSLALEYQSTNSDAAAKINDANAALIKRQKNYEIATQYLSRAETVVQKAEQSRLMEDFASAIATYNNGSSVYALVLENPDYQFPELVEAAERGVTNIKKSIREVLKQVLENAHLAVETGDTAVDEREYQRGIDAYTMVPAILEVIPEDDSAQAREKQDLLKAAEERIEKAKREKTEWEALQQQQLQQQAEAAE
jgi:tetratricopeptide (TPR) repeat protein